jgi:hypothetical protein
MMSQPLISELLAELIKRARAMTLKLLPIEVEQSTLTDPTSRIITPQVISAYKKAGGDFPDAVRTDDFVDDAMLKNQVSMFSATVRSTEGKRKLYARCGCKSFGL